MTKTAIVIGSGFGGAVTACRLAQAALRMSQDTTREPLRVILLERGRRYGKADFPRLQLPESMTSSPDLASSVRTPDFGRYSWRTDYGLFDVRNLGGLLVLQGAGYGGGSLIYANVALRAPSDVLAQWPNPYHYESLARYYDLAESVLDVTQAPSSYAKTARFEEAARALERDVIKLPLAVKFPVKEGQNEPPSPNRYGKLQAACNGCGDCDIGCTLHAKNTLDLNYLAQFDKIADSHPELAQAWTLAEVVQVTRPELTRKRRNAPEAEEQKPPFLVKVIRHDQGETRIDLDADYVFLAAGAVGTTELLMRSGRALGLENDVRAALGSRLFGNGDSLGVVFDTKQPSTPWSGPTITRAIVHSESPEPALGDSPQADSPAPQTWFLVQDGGIPPSLRLALGYFPGGLWLGRNRFATPKASDGPRRPSFGPLTDLFLDLPVLSGIFSRQVERLKPDRDEPGWHRYLPPDLRPFLHILSDPDGTFRREVEALDKRVMARLQAEMGRRYGLASWFPGIGSIINTGVLTDSVLGALRERFEVLGYLPSGESIGSGLLKLLTFLAMGKGPSPNSAIFLCMGPDHAWTLRYQLGQLRADRDVSGSREDVTLYGAQERVLRDFAEKMSGELRTNPSWTVGKRPVTVHTQGGAGMLASGERRSVTDEWGRVLSKAQLDLFVMDAAGFPTSVGVNPSLTIAAVAERKIEHFIQSLAGLDGWSNHVAEERDHPRERPAIPVEALVEQQLVQLRVKPHKTRHRPIGISWHEQMDGSGADGFTRRRPDPMACTIADKRGLAQGRHFGLTLDCKVDDLERFYLQKEPSMELKGHLLIREAVPSKTRTYQCEGRLWLGLRNGRMTTMNYDLRLRADDFPEAHLVGTKFIRDDPGLDSFLDLTTLNVVIDRPGERLLHGVVRVPASNFISKQLPTFKLIGCEDLDNTGKLWAAARFSDFFFGTIKETFLPEFFVQKQLAR
jgi:choline dehydrogenase-like flavoprotein